MDEITAASDNKPREHTPLRGPTVTLYRTGVTEETVEEENGTRKIYRYKELRFIDGEYDLVRQGQLPTGADSWTADLRRIERSGLYDEADKEIARANDHISTVPIEEVAAWEAHRSALRKYKQAIRDTVNASGFPAQVVYPQMPDAPN